MLYPNLLSIYLIWYEMCVKAWPYIKLSFNFIMITKTKENGIVKLWKREEWRRYQTFTYQSQQQKKTNKNKSAFWFFSFNSIQSWEHAWKSVLWLLLNSGYDVSTLKGLLWALCHHCLNCCLLGALPKVKPDPSSEFPP